MLPGSVGQSLCLVYADDVLFAIAHRSAGGLVRLAVSGDARVRGALRCLRLALAAAKCFNMVASPGELIGGVQRRSNGLSVTVNRELAMRDRRLGELLATVRECMLPNDVFPPGLRGHLPYGYQEEFRVLGVMLDSRMGMEAHVKDIIGRSMVRHGVMAQVGRSTWWLEVGTLRSTHSALLTSLVSYCLVVAGGVAYEELLGRLEVQQATIAARRIVGVSGAARLGVPRATADVLSVRNLYVNQCALVLDRALRAHNGSVEVLIREFADKRYGMTGWQIERAAAMTEEYSCPRRGMRGINEYDVREEWEVHLLPREPLASDEEATTSVHCRASDIEGESEEIQRQTSQFRPRETWVQVGARVLEAAGWRPDCSRADRGPLERAPPPPLREFCPFLVGALTANEWVSDAVQRWILSSDPRPAGTLYIEVDINKA